MRMYGRGLGKVHIQRNFANVGNNIEKRIRRSRVRPKRVRVKNVPNFGFSFGG